MFSKAIVFSVCVVIGLLGTDKLCFAASEMMEEVIVTAQKREENLQDTPISVTAFTADAIEVLGFRQSVDITAQTPNFSVGYPNGDTGVPAPFMRGVGLNDFGVLNQGPIAAYTDQTYISSNAAQIFQLLDVERVEVLRGPQGTLYGRNATGGAVNYVSRRPTLEWDGWARAGGGSWGSTKLEGAVGGPIGDKTAFRVSLLKSDSDGWMKNRLTGNDQQGIDELAWRVLLESEATENLNILVNVHGGKTQSDSPQYRHLGVWEADGSGNMCSNGDILAGNCVDIFGYSEQAAYTTLNGVDVPATPGYDEANYDFEERNDTDFWGASVTLDWAVSGYVITSITSYDEMDDFRPEETDDGPNDILTGELAVDQETFSQEFRIALQTDNVSWIAGLYYLNDEATDNTAFDILRDFRPFFVGDDVSCSAPAGNPGGFCPEEFIFKTKSGTKQEITSTALYVDASIKLTERLTFNGGLRYTDEEIDHASYFFFDESEAGFPARPGFPDSASNDYKNVSGRLLLDFQMTDDLLFYGGISTGFKAGGIQSTSDGIAPYDEEELVSYEIGFKTMLVDGRVRFNGSVFRYDYSDLQVFAFVIVDGIGFSTISNAADATNFGAELELQWLPTDNLFVNLGLGILNTEYEDFILPSGDFSGNEITMSPELTLNGLIQYDIQLGDNGVITLQTDFNYQDEVWFDALNNPLLSEDAYWLWNARVSWTSTDEKWEVAAFGRNLGDEQYMVYAFDLSFFGFNEEMLGTPRAYGIDATFRY
jgi:iron complex outermembrane receptor protein|tara:strand:- start:191 stop:2485 length:2295 start_codon:yes stop_codon:yes gene_type:complete